MYVLHFSLLLTLAGCYIGVRSGIRDAVTIV